MTTRETVSKEAPEYDVWTVVGMFSGAVGDGYVVSIPVSIYWLPSGIYRQTLTVCC
jgi:hypothetical protein